MLALWPRLIEALLSDVAKPHMVQESLSRQQLDARNSIVRDKDYYEIASDVFNDPDYTPTLVPAPTLHPELEVSRELPLTEYRMTRSKVKDVHDSMKNKLLTMMKAWEQSGNGAGQRDVSFGDDGWGHFDPETMDGDDRAQFLRNPNEYYLLYFWHRIDEEGVIAQTLSQLPQSMEASNDNFAIVSERDSKKDRRQIANSISKIADAASP